jgi:hypothetical protein
MALLTIYLALAVTVGLLLQNYFSRRALRLAKLLPHIPLVKFDENDTQERYISSTREVMHKGYLQVSFCIYLKNFTDHTFQYNKQGQAFCIRNPVDEGSPQVIMAKRYLDEVMNASEDKLSFPLYSIQVHHDLLNAQ